MQRLESLFRRFAKRSNARWWIGKRPQVRESQLVRAIAQKVALPTAINAPLEHGQMINLEWGSAAHILAVAGTTSLAYAKPSPSAGAFRDAKTALADLAGNASFLSNGVWRTDQPLSWISLTASTFDCGLIGFDSTNAFIFWVEEED
ncbi:hypothetical protein [Stakelama tenebrarum]|uniref:Uncharacterized protein n=1 Tax=Stakelama tenebrarum TaxID=2711215 RepID=A0A6G6Y8L7_9SPHN|nr:hypothetical protein [Sphingosinithalassobacter tenebrarum]QIG81058.1 hypothetical protein G5C33_15550 [Sphingosinithalassobacter tenebrarum]